MAADRDKLSVVIVTLDSHMASAADRAFASLKRELPGFRMALHAASEFGQDPAALAISRWCCRTCRRGARPATP
jgi:magnesium chelatase subunit H